MLTGDVLDLRVVQLYLMMTRDPSLVKFLRDRKSVESAFVYAGYPTTGIQVNRQIRECLDDDSGSTAGTFLDTKMMNDLYRIGRLSLFLTWMLRTGTSPKLKEEFARHLEPLGLEWDKKTNGVRPVHTHSEAETLMEDRLGELLGKIDVSFPSRLAGAWMAYFSQNPERYRNAVNSCRELLTKVIDKLAGDNLYDEMTGKKKTRRERVLAILGSKSREDEVAQAAASLVCSLYDSQSAREHGEPDESTALFALVETVHILYFLLSRRESLAERRSH